MVSGTDKHLFAKAAKLAKFGQHRVRVGCVAAIKRRAIAGAFNTSRNITLVKYTDRGNHAEMNTLAGVPYEKRDQVTFYVVRLSVSGDIVDSFPCEYCFEELTKAGIKNIVYWHYGEIRKVRM